MHSKIILLIVMLYGMLHAVIAATPRQTTIEHRNWAILPPVRLPKPITANIKGEHFTLGHKVAGAFPIKTYESTLTFEQLQHEVIVNIAYPMSDDDDSFNRSNDFVVTHVEVYLEGNDGMRTQVYVTAGGIEQHNIAMDIVVNDVDILHYLVFIYGIRDSLMQAIF